MASHKDYADYVMRNLDSLPQKYNDKNKEMVYRYGLLIGIIATLMHDDTLVKSSFQDTIKRLKVK